MFWNAGAPALPRVLDLTLPRPGREVPLRLYDPVGDGRQRPALVFLHGGGYVVGTLDTHDVICRELALASGHIVVNVDYALAPEFKFPWAIEETVAVGRFLACARAAISGANFTTQRFSVAWSTFTPRSAMISCNDGFRPVRFESENADRQRLFARRIKQRRCF